MLTILSVQKIHKCFCSCCFVPWNTWKKKYCMYMSTHMQLHIWTQIERGISEWVSHLISPLMTTSIYLLKVTDKASKAIQILPLKIYWHLRKHTLMVLILHCQPVSSVMLFENWIVAYFSFIFSHFVHPTKHTVTVHVNVNCRKDGEVKNSCWKALLILYTFLFVYSFRCVY